MPGSCQFVLSQTQMLSSEVCNQTLQFAVWESLLAVSFPRQCKLMHAHMQQANFEHLIDCSFENACYHI